MPVNVLVNNGERYSGKYVATRSFSDKEVVSWGDNPDEVVEEARNKGIEDPVIFYVPVKNMIQIY